MSEIYINNVSLSWIDVNSKCDTGDLPKFLPGMMTVNYTLYTERGFTTGNCEMPHTENLAAIKDYIIDLIYD